MKKRTLLHYPKEFGQFIEQVIATGQNIVLKCRTADDARKRRFHFYNYLAVLRRQAAFNSEMHETNEEMRKVIALATMSDRIVVQCKVEKDGIMYSETEAKGFEPEGLVYKLIWTDSRAYAEKESEEIQAELQTPLVPIESLHNVDITEETKLPGGYY